MDIRSPGPRFYLSLFLLAAGTRALVAVLFPGGGGDTQTYFDVALNILQNQCVSIADPDSGRCTPHWGGNQLPGYPLFVALVWLLTGGHSLIAVGIAQAAVSGIAACRLGYAASRFAGSTAVGWAVGAVVALSPAQIGWARMGLTESLVLAATVWLYAELILCLHHRQIRIWWLAAPLIVAFFVRYDAVFLGFAVAAVVIAINRPGAALGKLVILAAIVGSPYAAWTVRAAVVGLPLVPPVVAVAEGQNSHPGYLAWLTTWSTNEYEAARARFPAVGRHYAGIQVPARSLDPARGQGAAKGLLDELMAADRKEFPLQLDRRFADLAQKIRASEPGRQYVLLPLTRAGWLWLNPFNSFGWPIEIDTASLGVLSRLRTGDPGAISDVISQYPVETLGRGAIVAWRYTVLLAFVALVLVAAGRGRELGGARWILYAALADATFRTLFFGVLGAAESRYSVGMFAGIEIAVALVVALRYIYPSPTDTA